MSTGPQGDLSTRAAAPGDGSVAQQEQLAHLAKRLEGIIADAREMSRVLPSAVSISTQSGGLAEAMTPAVEKALILSSKRNPETLSRALFPVIGRAMRRALWDAICRAARNTNRFMLRYFSIKGLRWRLEARRRGETFETVFREHTHTFPVKQVFLIHRETGLLLQQEQSEIADNRDWDIISGMLTALSDFIHDSFNVSADEGLDTVRVGHLTVLIEQGPRAALAGILQGPSPDGLREAFRECLDDLHDEFAHELAMFNGEMAELEAHRAALGAKLRSLVNTERVSMLPQTWAVMIIPLLALALWLGFVGHEQYRWNSYVSGLRGEPGIVVIDEGRRDGRYFIYGLRDPMAVDPVARLTKQGYVIDHVDSRWAPYQALHSTLTLPRIVRVLDPPDSVTLELEDDLLVIRGTASQEWIDDALSRLKGLPGLNGYRTDNLVVSDLGASRHWQRYLERLEKEPGIIVIKQERRNGGFYISGLRDPLARDPEALMAEIGVPETIVESKWDNYQALHPTLTLKRARQVLQPPASVSLSLAGTALSAEGTAPYAWISRARALVRSVAGISEFKTDRLVDEDKLELDALHRTLEAQVFRFLVGSSDLWPGQGNRMAAAIDTIQRLRRVAARRGQVCQIQIVGFTTATGDKHQDQAISAELARSFFERLQWEGLDMRNISTRGGGDSTPDKVDQLVALEAHNRIVCFRVDFEDR